MEKYIWFEKQKNYEMRRELEEDRKKYLSEN